MSYGKINVVSDLETSVLRSQECSSPIRFEYSTEPAEADYHVIMGITRELRIPNIPARTIFIVQEPPEVQRFDAVALSHYGRVLAPRFRYLRSLMNRVDEVGLLPWRVGIRIEQGPPKVVRTADDLRQSPSPTNQQISVVTSGKSRTPDQVKRLRLIDFLSKRLPELEIYGRDSRVIDDKADALESSRFHLALENAKHPNYWSEKLADPILMKNITFYSGGNGWQRFFRSETALVEIDVASPKNSYEIIRRSLDTISYDEAEPALVENQSRIFEKYTLHHAILRTIAKTPSGVTSLRKSDFHIPAHKARRQHLSDQFHRTLHRHRARN